VIEVTFLTFLLWDLTRSRLSSCFTSHFSAFGIYEGNYLIFPLNWWPFELYWTIDWIFFCKWSKLQFCFQVTRFLDICPSTRLLMIRDFILQWHLRYTERHRFFSCLFCPCWIRWPPIIVAASFFLPLTRILSSSPVHSFNLAVLSDFGFTWSRFYHHLLTF